MTLRDALDKGHDRRKGRQCGLCTLLDSLTAQDRKDLLTALADPEQYGHTRISRALFSEGHNVSSATVLRHRRQCTYVYERQPTQQRRRSAYQG